MFGVRKFSVCLRFSAGKEVAYPGVRIHMLRTGRLVLYPFQTQSTTALADMSWWFVSPLSKLRYCHGLGLIHGSTTAVTTIRQS